MAPSLLSVKGTFFSRYEKKVAEYEKHKKFNEMDNYMIECIPFINEFNKIDSSIQTVDKLFGVKDCPSVQLQQLYQRYLEKVEKYEGPPVFNISREENDIICESCKSTNMILDDISSDYICHNCGKTEFYLGNKNLTYKEEQEHEVVFNYSYKRENHFNEWISQFQAQETTNIPHEMIECLQKELKKQKITNKSEITHAKVKVLLKKMNYNKYYEHVPYITIRLNGINPPQMSMELEARLRLMFNDIQKPFERHCPNDRKNFLSYSYVLYKFCELLDEDDYLPCFPLLKSKEKLYQQDVIWKKICNELQWEFIPTI